MLHEYGQMKLAPGLAGRSGYYIIPGYPGLVRLQFDLLTG